MAKNKENPIAGFEGKTIDLAKFNIESSENQYKIIENTLKEIYKDSIEVDKKLVYKVISLTYNPKDDYTYLPYDLKVSKEKLELKFEVRKRVFGIGWLVFSTGLLLLAIIGATYLGFEYLKASNINIDIDGDGIADINIDIDNDGKPDINIDLNGDHIPELNIDYMGNRKKIFNIDTNDDGKADFNYTNILLNSRLD